MLYYSEKDKRLYKTEEELKKAEKLFTEQEEAARIKKEERKNRANEVEAARKHYQELLKDFIKDYGTYHCSLDCDNIFDIFDVVLPR